MGTHPIFESDFDCLTDMSEGANYYNKSEFGSDFPALRRHVNIMGRYAGSPTPTSTDAPTSESSSERTPKFAAISETTFSRSVPKAWSRSSTSSELPRSSHL